MLIILSIHLFRWSYFKQAEFAGKKKTTNWNLYYSRKSILAEESTSAHRNSKQYILNTENERLNTNKHYISTNHFMNNCIYLWMNSLYVWLKIALLRKGSRTKGTSMRFFTSVLDHMGLQCPLLVKGFSTFTTFKRSFT